MRRKTKKCRIVVEITQLGRGREGEEENAGQEIDEMR